MSEEEYCDKFFDFLENDLGFRWRGLVTITTEECIFLQQVMCLSETLAKTLKENRAVQRKTPKQYYTEFSLVESDDLELSLRLPQRNLEAAEQLLLNFYEDKVVASGFR